jgi:hypothetical protein
MYKHYKAAEALANLLDNQFNFLGIKFGFAAIINLIPGFGDLVDAILSMYIVWIAVRLKLPSYRIFQMIWNIIINFIIGIIPVIGDATYILRRVNMKNFQILRRYAPSRVMEGEIVV